MIRFILRHRSCALNCGMQTETASIETIDGDLVKLEARLRSGGKGESGFELCELLGVEVIDEPAKEDTRRVL